MSTGHSVSGAKGKSKDQTTSPAADALSQLAIEFANETKGVRTGLLDSMQEVLSTGGSNIPIISRSVEASRQAGSQATQQTQEELARSGLAGTPFGASILADQRQQSAQNVAGTQQQLAQAIFQMIPSYVLGQSQTSTSGLAGAIPGMNTVNSKSSGLGTAHSTGAKIK